MKKDKIIYWSTTGIIAFMMTFSAIQYFTNPEMASNFEHLGFPDYFRKELGILKIVGVLVLIIPQIPMKLKEWAYAGFAIVMISASIAHGVLGDPAPMIVTPLVMLGILIVSNLYLTRIKKA